MTTGVGAMKRVRVGVDEQFSGSTACCSVAPHRNRRDAPEAAVRAAMLAQLAGFARGWSGVRAELADHLVAALNAGFAPRVRTVGSLGQSDLGPLADLAWRSSARAGTPRSSRGSGSSRGARRQGGARVRQLERVHARLDGACAAPRPALLDRFDEAAALTFEGMLGNVQALDPAVARRPSAARVEGDDRRGCRRCSPGRLLLTGELIATCRTR